VPVDTTARKVWLSGDNALKGPLNYDLTPDISDTAPPSPALVCCQQYTVSQKKRVNFEKV